MATLHTSTYEVESVDGGVDSLKPFEGAELGDLCGKRICHLQCHLGDDSISLARRGATVVGIDFSRKAIDVARRRSVRCGLAHQLSFVVGEVDEARSRVDGHFDVVYTTWGVLCWLADLDRWASTVASLLAPSGFLYLAETHPYAQALREGRSYGGSAAHLDDAQGDYTDDEAEFEHPQSWEWSHGLGEIVTAVVQAGLCLDWLHEHAEVAWHLNDTASLSRSADGMWHRPGSTLPLSFRARSETTWASLGRLTCAFITPIGPGSFAPGPQLESRCPGPLIHVRPLTAPPATGRGSGGTGCRRPGAPPWCPAPPPAPLRPPPHDRRCRRRTAGAR